MSRSRYVSLARRYWETYLPSRVAAIPQTDRTEFFRSLGRQVAREVEELTPSLAGQDPDNEQYLEKVGRLRNAEMRAEEQALAELVYLEKEPGTEDLELPQEQTAAVE